MRKELIETDVEKAILSLSISPLEIIFISVISLIGSLIHRYVIRSDDYKNDSKLYIVIDSFIVVTIDTIICVSIDQFIISLSPRLILLPPLLLGLIGKELIEYMSEIGSSFKLIEYILSFVGIHRKNAKAVDIDDIKVKKRKQKQNYINMIELERNYNQKILLLINEIDILISDYFDHKIDTVRFVLRYKKIILDIRDIKEELKRKEDISVNTAVKLSRLLKNQEYIDRIYNELLDKREHED